MKKALVIITHLIYWTGYSLLILFLFQLVKLGGGPVHFATYFQLAFGAMIFPAVAAFYFFYTVMFHRYLYAGLTKHLLLYGILFCLLLSVLGIVIVGISIGRNFLAFDGIGGAIVAVLVFSAIPMVHGAAGLGIKTFFKWIEDAAYKKELEKKNLEMELSLVKSQINPHFLFNTINNIDVLIEKDAVKASAYLNKLSDIMRFMLYETASDRISLSKELSYIEKYIELQKIRTANEQFVNYSTMGNADNIKIAPMVLIPFIENAFKHAEHNKSGNSIKIKIAIERDELIFECENKYKQGTGMNTEKSGIGNDLIKKRLQLIYPDNHTLHISDYNNTYKVKLVLNKHAN